uniref:HTH OST-type domain-containing protein n=1 Tax=Chromera velia CCMP2878 TaxID=1169474 RepID=A0A0G4HIW5_9ALVE|eukprot:Cvel_6996.t1-p1 / transcript=Cvel_6996.t1 / gene=Cvel_6996 / organism=Chromera_velia_CCMP2878 / gene_product=hypothetical protein / transcript_product=hypothetical protein / location=Cvel_scaffold356:20421-25215(+) / protein_length=954 / sequence_SO=supercontig / SO=protein_coding / is_pseudo=false
MSGLAGLLTYDDSDSEGEKERPAAPTQPLQPKKASPLKVVKNPFQQVPSKEKRDGDFLIPDLPVSIKPSLAPESSTKRQRGEETNSSSISGKRPSPPAIETRSLSPTEGASSLQAGVRRSKWGSIPDEKEKNGDLTHSSADGSSSSSSKRASAVVGREEARSVSPQKKKMKEEKEVKKKKNRWDDDDDDDSLELGSPGGGGAKSKSGDLEDLDALDDNAPVFGFDADAHSAGDGGDRATGAGERFDPFGAIGLRGVSRGGLGGVGGILGDDLGGSPGGEEESVDSDKPLNEVTAKEFGKMISAGSSAFARKVQEGIRLITSRDPKKVLQGLGCWAAAAEIPYACKGLGYHHPVLLKGLRWLKKQSTSLVPPPFEYVPGGRCRVNGIECYRQVNAIIALVMGGRAPGSLFGEKFCDFLKRVEKMPDGPQDGEVDEGDDMMIMRAQSQESPGGVGGHRWGGQEWGGAGASPTSPYPPSPAQTTPGSVYPSSAAPGGMGHHQMKLDRPSALHELRVMLSGLDGATLEDCHNLWWSSRSGVGCLSADVRNLGFDSFEECVRAMEGIRVEVGAEGALIIRSFQTGPPEGPPNVYAMHGGMPGPHMGMYPHMQQQGGLADPQFLHGQQQQQPHHLLGHGGGLAAQTQSASMANVMGLPPPPPPNIPQPPPPPSSIASQTSFVHLYSQENVAAGQRVNSAMAAELRAVAQRVHGASLETLKKVWREEHGGEDIMFYLIGFKKLSDLLEAVPGVSVAWDGSVARVLSEGPAPVMPDGQISGGGAGNGLLPVPQPPPPPGPDPSMPAHQSSMMFQHHQVHNPSSYAHLHTHTHSHPHQHHQPTHGGETMHSAPFQSHQSLPSHMYAQQGQTPVSSSSYTSYAHQQVGEATARSPSSSASSASASAATEEKNHAAAAAAAVESASSTSLQSELAVLQSQWQAAGTDPSTMAALTQRYWQYQGST